MEELQHLKTRVQEQCNELENSTQTAELEYKRNITDLHGAFEVSSLSPPKTKTEFRLCRMCIVLMIA